MRREGVEEGGGERERFLYAGAPLLVVRRPRLQVLVPRVCVFFLWFFLENIKVCEIAARASGQVPQVIDREETVHSCASCWLSSVAFVRHSMLPGKSGLS